MKKVLIIGCCGAGKSTLALKLAPILQLPLFHLDQLYWQPGWVESSQEDFEIRLKEVLKSESWLIDGNYSRTLKQRAELADAIIFLDFSTFDCITGVLKRIFSGYGKVRKDMTVGCPERFDLEFISYVVNFARDQRPKLMDCLAEIPESKQVITLKNRKMVEQFLTSIKIAYTKDT